MGQVVLARTSLTLHPPSPRTVLYLPCLKVSQSINCHDYSTSKSLETAQRTKKSGFLTQMNYSEKNGLGDLKGWSLNTGGFKDRFDYAPRDPVSTFDIRLDKALGCHRSPWLRQIISSKLLDHYLHLD